MIDDMQYPETPYAFDIETSMGDLRIEMEPTEFDAPSIFKIITYGGNTAPEATLKRYFHEFGFGMQGHRIDLEGDQAFPSDIYHVLTMSRTRLQEGKQGSILDFQVLGFVPPEGYADLLSDPDDDNSGGGLLESAAIDKEANKAAASPTNNLPEPTEAQKEAGNYPKGHVSINGLDIAIENPAGSERSGVGRDGKKWTSKLNHHYGYIKGTVGRDKDHLDVFLGPDPENADKVFIVNQTDPATGAFDEHKIMLGFSSEEEARDAYLSNHEEGWQGLGSICTLFMDEFNDWLKDGDTTVPILEAARESAIMERGNIVDFRDAVQGALSFDDIENVFADMFGPIVVKKFIFGEISELESQIKAMREKLAQVAPDQDGTGITRGEKTTAYLNDNSPIELQYAVMEADRLITSHTDEMSLNKDFSQDLQPRDRAREGMKFQVEQMAGKLNPERLGESTSVSTGAPIIGQDLTVESGNGRTIAIRKAYAMGEKGQEYKQWLLVNAHQFGIAARSIEGMERPVLVRIRLTEIDRAEFARKANEDEIAQMAPSELARADATKLTDDDVALFQPSEDGSIAAVANRAFITRFFEKMGANASTGYMTKDGGYTKQLVDRVQAAIFQKAYQDDHLLALMSEEADPKIKNILGAMTIAAGEFSRAKAIDASLMGIDIPRHVIEAANLIKKSREDNQAIEEALSQGGLFEDISEDTRQITLFIDKNIRSARRMGSVLKEAARILRNVLIDEKEPKLMETRDALPTPAQIVAIAIEKEKTMREGDGNLFESARNQDNFETDDVGLVQFPAGTIARDNQGDQTFALERDVRAGRESAAAYRIQGTMQGPKSLDSHWIYRRDNKDLFEKMARQAEFDWRKAIETAKDFGEIMAVFQRTFPMGAVQSLQPENEKKVKQPWEMTRAEFRQRPEILSDAQAYAQHFTEVKQALSEGLPVSAEVVNEYRDMLQGKVALPDTDLKAGEDLQPVQAPVANSSKAQVMRAVRDFGGNLIGRISEPYDGTEEGMFRAGQRVEKRMWLEYPDASGINSVTGATDLDGTPKWAISPNLKHVAELNTAQAKYIWGDINVFKRKSKNLNDLRKGEITHDS